MKKLRSRLTYANVMATLAFFIAVGGASAFAATQLAKNSVGTKQLKKNAVTTAKIKREVVTAAKIKKGTLTGAQINLSTLGTVPSAQTANSLAAPEPWHLVGTPGEPQFLDSWKGSTSESTTTVAFFKDQAGIVHLRGHASGNGGGIAFDLPTGFRPAAGKILDLVVSCGGTVGECPTGAAGGLNIVGPSAELGAEYQGAVIPPTNEVAFDGVSFKAES